MNTHIRFIDEDESSLDYTAAPDDADVDPSHSKCDSSTEDDSGDDSARRPTLEEVEHLFEPRKIRLGCEDKLFGAPWENISYFIELLKHHDLLSRGILLA
mmetsp:Transcript_39825/g.89390  ORF Transcript_39825/g.89390 Transcript_39825/m.89390 type:complete len:100 (-) Transcript_39825:41-340(-)